MKKIFISSIIDGYEDRRNTVEKAVQNFNRATNSDYLVIGLDQERSCSMNTSSREACLKAVKECDIYIGIYPKNNYGWAESPMGISPVHEEYREAKKNQKIMLIFVENLKGGEKELSKQIDFLREVGDYVDGRFWHEFSKLEELESNIILSLLNLYRDVYDIFVLDYKNKILENFQFIADIGQDFSLPLDEIIQLNIVETIEKEHTNTGECEQDPDHNISKFKSLSLLDVIAQYERAIIFGAPGSGKSVLLKWLTRTLVKDTKFESSDGTFVPIYVPLKLYDNNLFDLISLFLCRNDTKYDKIDITNWLKNGSFIFLLDGVDEITNYNKFYKEFELLLEYSSENKFILTSRNIEHETLLNNLNFKKFTINELSNLQIKLFIEKYTGESAAENLFKEIERNNLLNESRNPLILWFIIISLKNDKEELFSKLPFNKGLLFKNILENEFLKKWELKKTPHHKITNSYINLKVELLSEIAFSMIENIEDIKITENKVTEIIDNKLKEGRPDYKNLRDEILTQLVESCMIIKSGNQITFWHKSFRDYFASLKLLNIYKGSKKNFIEIYASEKWEESLLYFVGIIDNPSYFVNSLIKPFWQTFGSGAYIFRLVLAAKCIGVNKNVNLTVQDNINSQLKCIINSTIHNWASWNHVFFPVLCAYHEAIAAITYVRSPDMIRFLICTMKDCDCYVKQGYSCICQNIIIALENVPIEEEMLDSIFYISLNNKDHYVRSRATEITMKNATKSFSSKLLVKLIEDNETIESKMLICGILKTTGFDSSPQILVDIALNNEGNLMENAALTLNKYNGPDREKEIEEKVIFELLHNPNPEMRIKAFYILMLCKTDSNKNIIKAIIQALNDEASVVKCHLLSINCWGWSAVGNITWGQFTTKERKVVSKKLVKLFNSSNSDIRKTALRAYMHFSKEINEKEEVQLVNLLFDEHPTVRANAALCLGSLKDKCPVSPIEALFRMVLSENYVYPLACAIWAISKFSPPLSNNMELLNLYQIYLEQIHLNAVVDANLDEESKFFPLEILRLIGTEKSLEKLKEYHKTLGLKSKLRDELCNIICALKQELKK